MFVNEVKSPEGAVGLPQNSHILIVKDLLSSYRVVLVFLLHLGMCCYLKSVELLMLMVDF